MALLATASTLNLQREHSKQGIDEKELQEGNHWRKPWPEGHTDSGEGDADVLNRFNLPKKAKAEKDKELEWAKISTFNVTLVDHTQRKAIKLTDPQTHAILKRIELIDRP